MTKVRGFEVAIGWENTGIHLPQRATKKSAGYDFEAAEEVKIPSIWGVLIRSMLLHVHETIIPDSKTKIKFGLEKRHEKKLKPTIVHTGVKAYMQDDEALFLYNRSSNPLKRFLMLSNSVGVVDSDYYGNLKNDGEIMFQFINFGFKEKVIKKGERIGQGVFKKFLKADEGDTDRERQGGHGSSGVTKYENKDEVIYR